MNPFETFSTFNQVLYESVNKINKNSEKLIIQGFNEILNIEDPSISFKNVMIKNIFLKHLNSRNGEIKKLCSDFLLKTLETDKSNSSDALKTDKSNSLDVLETDNSNLSDVLALWFIKFIEDHSFKTDKIIYKKFINLDEIKNKVYGLLDWENDLINSLKVFTFVLKNCKEKDRQFFLTKLQFIKYNSNIILKYLYVILDIIGPIDEIYDHLVLIKIPVLMCTKWKILFKIYKKIPSCINKDFQFLEISLLEEICKNVKIENLENLKVKNEADFMAMLKFCDSKIQFYKNNKKFVNFCIFNIVDDFKEIDDNFEDSDDIFKSVLQKHFLNLQEKEEINEYVKKIDFIKSIDCQKIEKVDCDCGKTNLDVFKNLINTLKDSPNEVKIYRAYLLKLTLDSKYFDMTVLEKSKFSAYVFPKEDLMTLKNSISMICKYPEDYTKEEIYNFLTIENCQEIAQVKKFNCTVKKWLKDKNLKISNFDFKEFDLMFFCSGHINSIRFLDYDELCREYLQNLEKISRLEIFDQEKFTEAILRWLSDYHVPITLEYNDQYYIDIPHFYKNIELNIVDNIEIEMIKNFYKQNYTNDVEVLICLICNVILNEEYEKIRPKEIVKLDLKINNYFLYKVYKDLNWDFKEPFRRNKNIISLIEGGIDIIDLDKIEISEKNYKIIDQRILRGLIDFPMNLSHLSYKALEIFIDYFKDNFDTKKCDQYFLTNNLSEKRFFICKPVVDLLCLKFVESFEKNYEFIKNEKLAEDEDTFQFLISEIPNECPLFFNILIETFFKLRNLNLLFFIEKVLSKKNTVSFLSLYKNCFIFYQQKLAFLFPGIFRRFFKNTPDVLLVKNIKDLLIKETEYKLKDINTFVSISSSGIRVIFKYFVDENDYECEIFYSNTYPVTLPIFNTNVEKNSLLNLKISEMLTRTSKFTEVVNYWKINVDQKCKGAKECYICYFILHLQDGSFPNTPCFHCNNKFHNKCIQKWIVGYKKLNCPLCRNPLAFIQN